MVGNVLEWTAEHHARGGSYLAAGASQGLTTYSLADGAGDAVGGTSYGFRCAKSATTPQLDGGVQDDGGAPDDSGSPTD